MQERHSTVSTCFSSPKIASRRSIRRPAVCSPRSRRPAAVVIRGSRGRRTLWVGQYRDRKIHQIDPDTGAILRPSSPTASSPGSPGSTESSGTAPGKVRERCEASRSWNGRGPGAGRNAARMMVSGLESDGGDQFFCGGGKSGKVRTIRRPERGTAPAPSRHHAFVEPDRLFVSSQEGRRARSREHGATRVVASLLAGSGVVSAAESPRVRAAALWIRELRAAIVQSPNEQTSRLPRLRQTIGGYGQTSQRRCPAASRPQSGEPTPMERLFYGRPSSRWPSSPPRVMAHKPPRSVRLRRRRPLSTAAAAVLFHRRRPAGADATVMQRLASA